LSSIFDHTFRIVELYTDKMNIYGDTGNSLVLAQRFQRYGLQAEIVEHNIGDVFPTQVDIVVGGGGQDSSQLAVIEDLHSIRDSLRLLAEDSTPMLIICGMYQLFGHYFTTSQDERIDGIGILDIETRAGQARLIGNVVANSSRFGQLVGYENHSGQTFLGDKVVALSEDVKLGVGNNTSAKQEGAVYKNVLGTYLHGPFLPKNSRVADFLIDQAVQRKMGYPVTLTSSEVASVDGIAQRARSVAIGLKR
jgi:CobQ-like glutamine amidotransferase family enzyme